MLNMGTIKQTCESIGSFFNNIRTPFPQLSRIFMVSSMMKRPGLSVVTSVSKIVKDLNKLGIPTGAMPDGSENLTVGFVFASTNEIYRAIRNDMSVQVGIQPGTLDIMAGPVPGSNVTPGIGLGGAY